MTTTKTAPTIDSVLDVWSKCIYELKLDQGIQNILVSFTEPTAVIPSGRKFKLKVSIPNHLKHKLITTHASGIIKNLNGHGIAINEIVADDYSGPIASGNGRVGVSIERINQDTPVRIERNQITNKHDVNRAFVPVAHYATRFWQPLVGAKAFSLWNTLLTYDHACRTYNQPPPSTKQIANTLGYGSGTVIVGSPNVNGRNGIIYDLIKHRLATVYIQGEVPARYTYHFYVTEYVDFLTPHQIGQLKPSKQKEHLEYLQIIQRKTRGAFSVSDWQKITAETLLLPIDINGY